MNKIKSQLLAVFAQFDYLRDDWNRLEDISCDIESHMEAIKTRLGRIEYDLANLESTSENAE